ncbi:MAG: hypothetical protein MZW92_05405 [Comamonadaceae bacterium]|nr:hypothetical protein [Comamonadaceae bacterium]
MGVDDDEILQFLRQERRAKPFFQQLRPGKWITAKTDANGTPRFAGFPLNAEDKAIVVERREGKLDVSEQTLQLETRVSHESGEVHSSLFAATDEAGLPDNVAVQLDRDLRLRNRLPSRPAAGRQFSVVFETIYHQGQPLRAGRVLAAEFVNHGETHRAAYFAPEDGKGSYYAPDGKKPEEGASCARLSKCRASAQASPCALPSRSRRIGGPTRASTTPRRRGPV